MQFNLVSIFSFLKKFQRGMALFLLTLIASVALSCSGEQAKTENGSEEMTKDNGSKEMSKSKKLDDFDPNKFDYKARLNEIAKQENIELDMDEDAGKILKLWFEDMFNDQLKRSPMFQTFLGMKSNYDKWDDVSQKAQADEYSMARVNYHVVARFKGKKNTTDKLNDYAESLMFNLKREMNLYDLRHYNYVFSQFRGPHSSIPAFMINYHRVDTKDDALAYIKRIENAAYYLRQNMKNAELALEEKKVAPPKWTFPQMRETAANIISGYPFDGGEGDNAIFADFKKKIANLKLSDEEVKELTEACKLALLGEFQHAYKDLIFMFNEHEKSAPEFDGVGGFAGGDKYYNERLALMTSLNISPQEVHDLGLQNVARIHKEMDQIREKVGFKGDLKEFFVYMRNDPDDKFTYPNNDEGRQAYLDDANIMISNMKAKIDDYFGIKPKADLIVKRVEPFREKAAGKAFYNSPAIDGSRPGIYYANLYNMKDMPKYQMEALAYHEAIPGHHMQRAISQEIEDVPTFVKFQSNTAYTEGWGLYSEYLAKEMGFYTDPYSDFGRLAMELWRAARLVVDTGLHYKGWSREEAIDYLLQNTPNPEGDCVKAIERYSVMPAQATAYMIGKIKLLELRQYAMDELGDDFDIKEFHDLVLGDGSKPLKVLEGAVKRYVAQKKNS